MQLVAATAAYVSGGGGGRSRRLRGCVTPASLSISRHRSFTKASVGDGGCVTSVAGTVKLTSAAHNPAGWRTPVILKLVGTRHRLPFDEGPRSQHTMMGRPQQMSAHPEEILHHAVDRREALQMAGQLEAPHLAFPLACGLVRDFGAVVRILIRDVNDRRHHGPRGRRVAPQFVGDQPAGYAALAFQQLPEKAHCGAPVPPRLHQDVEDVAVLVYRPPQVLLTTVQRDEQLIEVPRVPEGRPRRCRSRLAYARPNVRHHRRIVS